MRNEAHRAAAGLALVAATLAIAAPVNTQLDWDTVAWPNGSLSEVYTVGPGDVALEWTGAVGTLIQQRPQIAQAETGGLTPPQDSLSVRVNFGGPATQQIVLTVDFTHPGGVTDVSFTLFDVDAWGFFLNPYVDQIQVTATSGGGQVNPSSVAVVNPAFVNFDGTNMVTGQQVLFDSQSANGNATFTFNQPGITQLQLVYRSPPGAVGNPGQQYISIHDISFTYDEPAPDLLISKSFITASDPVNGDINPRAIPGATVTYTVAVSNSGSGAVDSDTVQITDAVPANTVFRISDFDVANPGPVAFVDGTTSSGLSYTFLGLGNAGDDIEFSNNGGSSYVYTPADIGDGTDPAVTHIRVNPQGSLAASGGADPGFQLRYNVVIQ